MVAAFEYGQARIRDIVVETWVDGQGKTNVRNVQIDGRPLEPTPRFWNSLHVRFGFTQNIFRYFRHDEVFERISQVSPNDRLRWCIERDDRGRERLLGVSNPTAALIQHQELVGLLQRYQAEEISYDRKIVTNRHAPRADDTHLIAGDDFQNKYVLDTPIDGFGRPAVYLSLLRLICSNGAIGYSPAFRSELSVGKLNDQLDFALVRVLEGFNNEEGFAAIRQRFESASRSWASVHEVRRLYKVLVGLHHQGQVHRGKVRGGGNAESEAGSPLLSALERKAGDLSQIYGLANLDALSVKRQRTLPATCKVYELLNFASEAATHHVEPSGQRTLQAYIGELISGEYDLEGTADRFSDWQDFFIGHDQTTSTLASLQSR